MEIEICGKFKVLFDKAELELVSRYRWHVADYSRHNTTKLYARCMTGPRKARRTVYMHRIIMGEPLGMVVDHINHNGLDNRRANLRIMPQKQNARLQQKRRKADYSYEYEKAK